MSWYSNISFTRLFSFNTPITEDTNIYGQKKYYPYNKISSSMNKQEWDSKYYYDITKNEIQNAAVSYGSENYFYLYFEEGQTAIIATDTQYLQMESNIMLAISGVHGEMLNGGGFINLSRTVDCLGHVGLTFQVAKSGYYYIAVINTNSSLPNFDYLYSICAVVE
jgi:hypothetical protein